MGEAEVTIRTAQKGDAGAIGAIWNPQIRDTLVTFNSLEKSSAEIADMITRRPAFMLAERAGVLLGFASYDQFRAGIGYAHSMEHTIILAPEAWGRGVGRALMGAIERHARAAGVHAMMAGVSGGNEAGVRFHTALGYAQVAVVPEVGRKFGRWLDLVLMQKML